MATKDDDTTGLKRPYNAYNIFFKLERVRIVVDRGEEGAALVRQQMREYSSSIINAAGYEAIEVPPLPPRFAHLAAILPSNFLTPGFSRRKHGRAHGLASFKEIAKIAADNWKTVDRPSKHFCEALARKQLKRFRELKKAMKSQEESSTGPSAVSQIELSNERSNDRNPETHQNQLPRATDHGRESFMPIAAHYDSTMQSSYTPPDLGLSKLATPSDQERFVPVAYDPPIQPQPSYTPPGDVPFGLPRQISYAKGRNDYNSMSSELLTQQMYLQTAPREWSEPRNMQQGGYSPHTNNASAGSDGGFWCFPCAPAANVMPNDSTRGNTTQF